mmetsp:Transcript_11452/g.12965  ORF Transcript_11452/g.12965 Transcript_11452/m.12965 type:complete len:161 (+) Transcript_11452:354-836(+)
MTGLVSPNRWDNQNRMLSLSPTVYDRSKLAKLMKKYTFVRPSLHRYRSPDVQTRDFCMSETKEDAMKHHFDLSEIKKKLFSKKIKKYKPRKPALTNLNLIQRPKKKESDLSVLFLESPFLQDKPKTHHKVRNLNISDKEIEKIRDQIWTNMNQNKTFGPL